VYSLAVQTGGTPDRSWGLGNVSAQGTLEIPKSRVGKPDEQLPKAGVSIAAGARWQIVQCTHRSSRIMRRLASPLISIRAERLRTSDDGTCGAVAKIGWS